MRYGRLLTVSGFLMFGVGGAGADDIRAITHQNVERSFIVTNARSAAETPKPVVIDLHGLRDPHAANTSWPALDAVAVHEGFVAIYPAALEGSWNPVGDYGSEKRSRAGDEPADDIGFIVKLIDRLLADKIADPARIYVSGVSQGGFMTYSIMCDLAERIAGAAAIIAVMDEPQVLACNPSRAVPLLVMAGTNDPIVVYDGWIRSQYRQYSVPEMFEFWRRKHGCTGQKASLMPHRETEMNPTRTLIVEWTGCVIDRALILYRIQGGGHQVPSLAAVSQASLRSAGAQSRDFDAAEEIWKFFERFSR
jgi:polyhydroxybutyrate depolymerase